VFCRTLLKCSGQQVLLVASGAGAYTWAEMLRALD